ncbi:class I SAM-dependent methyltransferase [Dactylosporangium sp. CS-033363]|uniref:class I SAM-dependent methyltransferase n=1 Tax=Dactylosporangium sp. CS-033363 TaxID=3239935 RepID=UPI003D92C6AB
MPTPSHEARAVAESFGADAEGYDRARPSYPAALIERIPQGRVLDVGCGTGIVARQLKGRTVLGVEPDPRMAEVARRHGIEVEIAKIEEWDPAGRTFDAVVAGQTWHWVEPMAGARTVAKALRPGGLVTMFWNGVDPPEEVGVATMEALRRHAPDMPLPPRYSFGGNTYRPLADKAADGLRATGAFTEPEDWIFPWERVYTRREWLDQLATSGFANRLPPEVFEQIETPATFTVTYSTVATAAYRN